MSPYLLNLWRDLAGLPEIDLDPKPMPPPEQLRATEWCADFERLQRNRMIMGAFRYGLLGAEGKPVWDRMEDIARRAGLYRQTGNLELLVDIANMAQLEYVEGRHPLRHWKAVDDQGHTEAKGA